MAIRGNNLNSFLTEFVFTESDSMQNSSTTSNRMAMKKLWWILVSGKCSRSGLILYLMWSLCFKEFMLAGVSGSSPTLIPEECTGNGIIVGGLKAKWGSEVVSAKNVCERSSWMLWADAQQLANDIPVWICDSNLLVIVLTICRDSALEVELPSRFLANRQIFTLPLQFMRSWRMAIFGYRPCSHKASKPSIT